MKRSPTFVLMGVISLLLFSSGIVRGGNADTEKSVLKAFFTGPTTESVKLFHGDFLKAVPPAKLTEIRQMYQEKLGEFRHTIGEGGKYDLFFARGKAPCTIHLNASGLVDGLWLGNWTLLDDSPEKILEGFRQLAGQCALTVQRNASATVLDLAGDRPLAVGSSFKLYILETLADAIASGACSAEGIQLLRPDWYSLPSGILQDWPAGTPLTIQTLANLMISRSDNTATDHLLFHLGRERVEAVTPERVRPLLSTMEMFRLKYGPKTRAEAWLKADLPSRRKMLASLPSGTIDLQDLSSEPRWIDSMEWLLTTQELCGVIWRLRNQGAIRINPGLVSSADWDLCGYKGGSEPGVLNYTLLLRKSPGSATYALSATINDEVRPVDEKGFTELVLRLIGLIESGAMDPLAAQTP